ncbi:MAG: carboxypeptidase regulatory-like domain-containing protein [Bryobacteraceae bacterium]
MKLDFATRKFAALVAIAGFLAFSRHSGAADLSLPVTGNLFGSVVDAAGTPQMGATVQLFNKYERLIAKSLTAPDGRFAFAGLPVDLYSVRVSLASFLPVSREKIPIKAGLDSMLQIHLATIFSNIELSYAVPTGAMTDDWKWVLRSSPSTRPINRFLPLEQPSSSRREFHPRVFSGTHAMLLVSGGDGGLIDFDSTQGDLGTGFALSTNILGKNQLQVGGTVGQNANFGPSAMSLCAIYSRKTDGGFGEPPEITLTMSQLGHFGAQLPAGQTAAFGDVLGQSAPVLRTMSLSVYEVADPLDSVHLEYGITGESVDYLQHTSRVSPFARMSVQIGAAGELIAAYSDGGRPDELTAHQQYQTAELDAPTDELFSTVNTLARLPQLSQRNGRLELQRTQNYEIGYNKVVGSRTYAVSTFYERVSNGRMNVAGDVSALDVEDLLSDGVSRTSTYNIGDYQRKGYLASANQRLNDFVDLTLAYGRMGGFMPSPKFLDEKDHNLANVNLRARAPKSGTQFSATYGWMDADAFVPRHVFTTQNTYVAPGLSVLVRQPLPSFFGMPGRLELTADLRNLLAQGYVPLNTMDGRTLLIVPAPRALSGGLNFIF